MSINYKQIAAVSACLVAAGLIWFNTSTPPLQHPSVEMKSITGTATDEKPTKQVPPETIRQKNQSDYASQRLNKLFAQATDYRIFALEALQHPEEGGLFYANLALEFCQTDTKMRMARIEEAKSKAIAKNGTLSPEGVRQADKYLSRCANLTPDETSKLMVENFSDTEKLKKDPLLTALQWDKVGKVLMEQSISKDSRGTQPLKVTDSLIQNMQQLLNLQDSVALGKPNGLRDYVDAISYSNTSGGTWFNGELIPSIGSNTDHWIKRYPLLGAIELSLCKIGSTCLLKQEMEFECSQQNCFSSIEDFFRSRTNGKDGVNQVADKALALEPQVTAAILNRDVNAFLPKK